MQLLLENEAFLEEICANPTDYSIRLIYADFLDENVEMVESLLHDNQKNLEEARKTKIMKKEEVSPTADYLTLLEKQRKQLGCLQLGGERAKFVRAQCNGDEEAAQLLFNAHGRLWNIELLNKCGFNADVQNTKNRTSSIIQIGDVRFLRNLEFGYCGGFVEKLTIQAGFFACVSPILRKHAPLREVQLTTHLQWEVFPDAPTVERVFNLINPDSNFYNHIERRISKTIQQEGESDKETVLRLIAETWEGIKVLLPVAGVQY